MNELIEYLGLCVEEPIPNDTTTRILSHITSNDLGMFLEKVLLSRSRLQEIADNSYTHQLGFEKYTLKSASIEGGISLRMHYWKKDAITPFEGEIHDHCHDFTSKAFIGSLFHTFYKLNPLGNTHSLYEYKLDQGTKVSNQQYIKRVGVDVFGNKEVRQGTCYSLTNDTLHSVDVGTEYVVSLFLQGRQVKTTATVLKSLEKKQMNYKGIGIGKISTEQTKIRFVQLAQLLRSDK